jgi:DNA helicase TIP49 (TBP-interacting protein)
MAEALGELVEGSVDGEVVAGGDLIAVNEDDGRIRSLGEYSGGETEGYKQSHSDIVSFLNGESRPGMGGFAYSRCRWCP